MTTPTEVAAVVAFVVLVVGVPYALWKTQRLVERNQKNLDDRLEHLDAALDRLNNSVQTLLLKHETFELRLRSAEHTIASHTSRLSAMDERTREFWERHGHRFRD